MLQENFDFTGMFGPDPTNTPGFATLGLGNPASTVSELETSKFNPAT